MDYEGRIMDSEALRKRIFYGGVEHELRKEVRILLYVGYYELSDFFFLIMHFLISILNYDVGLAVLVGIPCI